MPGPTDQRTERLRAEIELKRAALFEHRTQLFKLQTQLHEFAEDYERLVGKLEKEVEEVRAQIEQYRNLRRPSPTKPLTEPAEPGRSWLEDFLARYREDPKKQNQRIEVKKAAVNADELRSVYRRLARKYHPDTTTDTEEKKRLSAIMARINAAYEDEDIAALRKMDGSEPSQALGPMPARETTYDDLLNLSYQLDDEIAWTKIEYDRLMNGALMSLKIECSLGRSQGRDVLREMAARLRRELETARAQLAAWQRQSRG